MGLLDEHNPRATRRSAAAWAVGSGLVGGLVGLLGWFRSDMPTAAVFFIVPWMAAFCGLAGWAIEWQMAPDRLGLSHRTRLLPSKSRGVRKRRDPEVLD